MTKLEYEMMDTSGGWHQIRQWVGHQLQQKEREYVGVDAKVIGAMVL